MNANKLTINYTKTKFTLFSKISPLTFPINLSSTIPRCCNRLAVQLATTYCLCW